MIDRFGPLPREVKELLNTLRLQWMGKAIGFEKISFKKHTLKGYFISNQQSPYFESEQFNRVIQFVQQNPWLCNLKEVKKTLRIAFENIQNIQQAIDILAEIAQPELTAK